MKDSVIRTKSFEFGLRVVKLADFLFEQKNRVLADQVLRSGTSIGSNVEEAAVAISRKEFVAKSSIAYKEARETLYWLRLLKDSGKIEIRLAESFLEDCEELCKILSSIIKSTRENSSL
jgi:four helix bundle protein